MSSWNGSVPRVRTTPLLSSTSNRPPAARERVLLDDYPDKSDDLTSVSDKEVVEVVVCVGVFWLEGEHRGVGGCVQFHHRLSQEAQLIMGIKKTRPMSGLSAQDLHRERPVDEVGRLVVDVFHLDDHPLVVRICIKANVSLQHGI